MAKLGLLYLQNGVWEGKQVLPSGWAETASQIHVPTPDEEKADNAVGYGFQFWNSRHGYRADARSASSS